MSNPVIFQLDNSLEGAIARESLDGRRSLFDDLRTGFHAKLVLAAKHHDQTSRREAHAIGGDCDIMEYGRMSAHEFHALHSGVITAEGFNDDVEDFYFKKDPSKRVHYVPRTPTLFIGSKYGSALATA
tara:strand:- start:1149 stop:1532 length:384 start_codon:yes stop_codon:yes gene_type:complete